MATTVGEVAGLLLQYTGETDRTFYNNPQISQGIQQGYREFVRMCQAQDNSVFVNQIDLPFVNQQNYDLADSANAVCLVGPVIKPTGAKPFFRITNLALKYPSPVNNRTLVNWQQVQDISQFNSATTVAWNFLAWQPGYYMLLQNTIKLPCAATATFQLTYQGDYWPVGAITANTELDDLGQFSDLIALLAARSYGVRDKSRAAELKDMRKERIDDLKAFMSYGRDVSGPPRVAILP